MDIAEGEGGGVQFSFGVFVQSKEEKESHDNHVGNDAKKVRRCWEPLGYVCDATNDRDGDRFNAVVQRVFDLPRGKVALEMVVRVEGLIRAGICGPHREERQCNCP